MGKLVIVFLTVWTVLFYLLLQFPLHRRRSRRTLLAAGLATAGGAVTVVSLAILTAIFINGAG